MREGSAGNKWYASHAEQEQKEQQEQQEQQHQQQQRWRREHTEARYAHGDDDQVLDAGLLAAQAVFRVPPLVAHFVGSGWVSSDLA